MQDIRKIIWSVYLQLGNLRETTLQIWEKMF